MKRQYHITFLKSSRELKPEVTDNQFGIIYLNMGHRSYQAFDKGLSQPYKTKKSRDADILRINAAAHEIVCTATPSERGK